MPNLRKILNVVSTSFNTGTLVKVTGSVVRIAAKRIGSAAFLAPEILTEPLSVTGPVTRNFSIVFP